MKDRKAYRKAYYEAHKDQMKAASKAYYHEHQEVFNKDYYKARYQARKEYFKSNVNALGQTKHSIRMKSLYILKKMNLNIPGYEIHHCFGYEDASKFIYISKSLHSKIHQYLRDNHIDAGSDHWMSIRDLVNSTDEFMYIKC